MTEYRVERDTMGEVKVPAWALWGASTQRAIENFPVSGITFSRRFIRSLAVVKGAAAQTNAELGLLQKKLARLIAAAADDIAEGGYDDHFPLDVFQTGSGTSTNTNANEVIANLANERAGSARGTKKPVHPSDHVNMGQSSNDVIPTVIHLAALDAVTTDLLPELKRLHRSLSRKARSFDRIVKPGRTHLMDAFLVRLGQEFSGYARQIELGEARVRDALPRMSELALGGTAVGTGLNAHPQFARRTIARVGKSLGLKVREAENHFEAQGGQDAPVELSGALKTLAASIVKISNDLRWMNSGPTAGLAEIRLPDLQPGSSIMAGKVNPVIPEVAIQVGAQVIGNDVAIGMGAAMGNFELNVMLPLIAHNLLQQIALLSSVAGLLVDKCVDGLEVDEERCSQLAEQNPGVVSALNPLIGYEKAAEVYKKATAERRTIRDVVLEMGLLTQREVDRALNLRRLTEGGVGAGEPNGTTRRTSSRPRPAKRGTTQKRR